MDKIDLLTVGEALVRLSVPPGKLLAETLAFDVNVAGAESNVAVAVARMGYRARWLSRLTDNILGRRIADTFSQHGVDCTGIVWTAENRVGTYYLEFGASPRPTRVVYDRAYSAASKMGPQTFDLSQLAQARIIHLTGITPALSDDCYALIDELLTQAKRFGVHVVFDVNYRERLWSAEVCSSKLTPFLERADTLIIARRDATKLFQLQDTPEAMLRALQNRFGVRQVAMTLAERGAIGLSSAGLYEAHGYPVTIIDRIGAGDAFAAGVICGLLEDNFGLGLEYGVAMSALKLGLSGDLFRLSRPDVLQIMGDKKDSAENLSR